MESQVGADVESLTHGGAELGEKLRPMAAREEATGGLLGRRISLSSATGSVSAAPVVLTLFRSPQALAL